MLNAVAMVLSLSIAGPLEQSVDRLFDADFAGAEKLLDAAETANPADVRVPYYRAATCWYAELARDPDGDGWACLPLAEVALERALAAADAHPDDARLQQSLGRAYGLRARLVTMHTSLRAALGDLRRAHRHLTSAERIDPSLRAESVELGLYEYMIGKLPSYAAILRFLLFMPGGDCAEGLERLRLAASTDSLVRTEASLYLAVLETRHERRPELGVARLYELVVRYPNNSYFMSHLASDLRRRLHQPREALEWCRAAEAMADEGSAAERVARLGIGEALAGLGELERARPILRELEESEGYVGDEALRALVWLDLQRGDREAANEAYIALGKRDGPFSEFERRRALHHLTTPLTDAQLEIAAAVDRATQARRLGERSVARQHLERLGPSGMRDGRVMLELGELDFDDGLRASAQRRFEAVAARPGATIEHQALAQLRLGQVEDLAGHHDRAREHYRQVLPFAGVYSLKALAERYIREPYRDVASTAALTAEQLTAEH